VLLCGIPTTREAGMKIICFNYQKKHLSVGVESLFEFRCWVAGCSVYSLSHLAETLTVSFTLSSANFPTRSGQHGKMGQQLQHATCYKAEVPVRSNIESVL